MCYNPTEKYNKGLNMTHTSNETVIQFKVIDNIDTNINYTDGCSGERSDCCTRICTRDSESNSLDEWDKYLEVDSGIIQY